MIEIPATLGILLAGGLARRMGGGDKPMRRIGGRTILERVIPRALPILACRSLPTRSRIFPDRSPAFWRASTGLRPTGLTLRGC
jgi:molybdenum cofactor guanylyltransferase